MIRPLSVRIAGAFGITSLAVLFVGLIPFLDAGPSVGAALTVIKPTYTVNREFKGDRLPLPSEINSAVSRNEPAALPVVSREIPIGCDRSFSPITAPHLAYVYGRCAT